MLRVKAIGAALAVILTMMTAVPAGAQTTAELQAAQAKAEQFDTTTIAAFQNDLAWVSAYEDPTRLPIPGRFDSYTFNGLRLFQKRSKQRVNGLMTRKQIDDLKVLADFSRQARGYQEITESGVTMGYPAKLVTQREDRQSGPRFKSPSGDIVLDILHIPESKETFNALYQRLKAPAANRKISNAVLTWSGEGVREPVFVITGTNGSLAFYMRFIQANGESRGFAVSWDMRTSADFEATATAMAMSLRPADGASVSMPPPASQADLRDAHAPPSGVSTTELNTNIDLCSKSTDAEQTIAACSAALAVGDALLPSNRPVVLFNRSIGYSKRGDKDLAIADLDKALALAPDRADYYTQRGHMYYNKKQFDPAIADYSKANGLKPDDPKILGYRGNAYFDSGVYDRAYADYAAALRLNPDDADMHASRGSAALRLGMAAEALPDLDFILEKGGSAILAGDYINHGVALTELGRGSEAASDFRKAETLANAKLEADGSKDAVNLAYRAFARAYGGDPDGAITDATKYLSSNPTDPAGFHARGLGNAAKGDYTRAIVDFSQAIGLGRPGFILRQRGDAYLALGEPDLALADYQAMLKRAPGNALATAGLEKARQALAAKLLATGNPPQGGSVPAQTVQTSPTEAPAALGRRVALVIGNGNYAKFGNLPNPKNDAAKVAETLRKIGFAEVTLVEDVSNQEFNTALQNFARDADGADWAVVYYAGHGIEVSNTNYLIPVDAKLASDRDVDFETVPLERVMAASEGAKGMRLVILDACRDNPFAANMARKTATRSVSRGLSRVEPDGGTLVVYAAKAGQVAQDGDGGNSPFVTALTNNLQKPNIEIGKLFRLVRDDVMKATNRQQEPFTYGSLPGEDFIFNPAR